MGLHIMTTQEENYECEYCLKRMKKIFESYKHSSEEDKKYTSFVFSLGYATMITFFTTIHRYLIVKIKCLFIFFICISIALFIVNEIWKMLYGMKNIEFQNKLWKRNFRGEISLDELEREQCKYDTNLYSKYIKFYYPIFWTSLITGFLAAILIIFVCLFLIFKQYQ